LSATRSVDRTDHVIATARLSQKQITDIQAGLRSYYIIRDRQYLKRYDDAHSSFTNSIIALERLAAPDPGQKRRVGQIRADFSRWFATLQQNKTIPASA